MTEFNSGDNSKNFDEDDPFDEAISENAALSLTSLPSMVSLYPMDQYTDPVLFVNPYKSQIDFMEDQIENQRAKTKSLEDENKEIYYQKSLSEKEALKYKAKLDEVLNFCNERLDKPFPKSYHLNPYGLMEKEFLLDEILKIIKSQ